MRIVKFGNPGTIDPRLWATFGVSAKDADDSIGQFGTGLKYAIAVCLREGRRIWIESGGKKYEFEARAEDFRGKEFKQVFCNGEAMPYTTHLGSKWELWQAYRELYSNCVDEGGDIGQQGDTVVYAELSDIHHADVFLSKTRVPFVSTRWCDIYPGKSSCIYVKGIRAQDLTRPSLFTYNLKSADLTEDRTIKYNYQVPEAIMSAVVSCSSLDVLEGFMLFSKDLFEETLSSSFVADEPSEAAISMFKRHRKSGRYMHREMASYIHGRIPIAQDEPEEMTKREVAVVEKAIAFCEKINMPVKYPVFKADLGAGTLGRACRRSNTIWLSRSCLEQGTKQVAATLIEENIHIAENLDDCCYEMQSRLFDIIVTLGEELTGDIL